MWIKNKKTGVAWKIEDKNRIEYLLKNPDYEEHIVKKTKKGKTEETEE